MFAFFFGKKDKNDKTRFFNKKTQYENLFYPICPFFSKKKANIIFVLEKYISRAFE